MTGIAETSPIMLGAAAKKAQVVELRLAGATYRQIHAQLGISLGQAHHYVTEALDELAQQARESAEQLRDLDLMRLDGMMVKLAKDDSPRAIDTKLRIMERRAKLMGLDAPTEISGPGGGPITFANATAGEDFMAKIEALVSRVQAGEPVAQIAESVRAEAAARVSTEDAPPVPQSPDISPPGEHLA